jgi:hypothetical protein
VHADARIERRHEGQRRADRLAQVIRLVVRLDVEDGPAGPVPVPGEVETNRRLRACLDHHQLGALARLGDQASRSLLGLADSARPDVPRLHGRRGVHHQYQPLGALPLEGQGRPGQRRAEEQERQELEQQQRVELQPLEERRRLLVTEHGRPQENRGHAALLAPHLQEIEEEQRDRQPQQQEGPGLEEAHWSRPPFSRRRSRSSTGISEATRT